MDPETQSWTETAKQYALAVLGIIFVIVMLMFAGGSCSTSTHHIKKAAADAVIERMKSPSTADMCSYSEMTVRQKDDDTYEVTGYVDGQNSFGAVIRNGWKASVTIHDTGGEYVYVTFY